MGLSIGIVGLPNVGKSTTFNALTKAQNAQAQNYPFCTIEPNKAIVELQDERLIELSKIVNPQKIQRSVVEFVDIAGLVRGASKGEGLGNQFLSNIRECECILHVVRCFEDSSITHVDGDVNPIHDAETIELELILSDFQSLEKKIAKLEKNLKASKDAKKILDIALELKSHLESTKKASSFPKKDTDEFKELNKELRLLSAKEMIYCANVDEDSLANGGNDLVSKLKEHASSSEVIIICAKLEEDLISLEEGEKDEFLSSLNTTSGLDKVIKLGFQKLGLISYFTAGVKEVRSWTINKGDTAPKAASVIHNDFEKGFIRAECIKYEDFIKYSGEQGAKNAGAMRLEGKEYVVQDGDILHFRFNV